MSYLSRLSKRITLGWLTAGILIAGCAVPDATTAPSATDPEIVPARIRITPEIADIIEGDSTQFTATVLNRHDVPLTNQSVAWRSSNAAVLTITTDGTSIAVDTGEVSLVATVGSIEASLRLRPRLRPVATVIVSPGSASMLVGESRTIGVTLRDSRGQALTGRVVTWSSNRPDIATVDASGRVTAITVGTAAIMATSEGISGTSMVTTAPIPAPSAVSDLRISAVSDSALTLAFAQVNDGLGAPARYIVRSGTLPFAWSTASIVSSGTCAAPIAGTAIGATLSCSVRGLNPSTRYAFQVVAVRGTIGPNAVYGALSNIDSATTAVAPVASVTLTPAATTLQVGGGAASLSAGLRDGNGNVLTGRAVSWTSSNAAIATVSSAGVVTPVSAGSATITATSEGRSGTAAITVTAAPTPGTVSDLRLVAVNDTSATIAFTEVANGLGAPASYDVRFARSPLAWGAATSVARGSCGTPLAGAAIGQVRTCTVLGLAVGTAYQIQLIAFRGTLDVNAVFGQQSNVVSATTTAPAPPPAAVATVTLSPTSANLIVGGSATTLTATLRDAANAVLTGRTIAWSSSNSSIATVSPTGIVTPVSAGTATISATSEGRSGSATITVANPAPAPVATVSITPSTATLAVGGGSTTLTATLRDASNTVLSGRSVSWGSSNSAVATVSASGVVTPIAAGSATITASSEGRSASASVTVTSPAPPPSSGLVPGASDVVVYDDDFRGYSTLDQRHARRSQLLGGSAPFYFFDGPDAGAGREALDSIIAGGFGGSPYAYRVRVPASMNNFYQASMYGEVFHRSPLGSAHFNPAGTTLVVDMWIRVDYPAANLLWIKGLEMFHSYDRTQYSMYLTGGSLGWANIHPQSNNREIYMHLENGAADAPAANRRWSNISTGTWKKHTFVYKASSGTGTARDGINRWYVDDELIIDASQAGRNNGWMVDRVNGVQSSSTSPFPGNVGDKYSSVTGDQALLGLADDPVIQMIFPGIISTSATGGGGTIDIGRIRIWYR